MHLTAKWLTLAAVVVGLVGLCQPVWANPGKFKLFLAEVPLNDSFDVRRANKLNAYGYIASPKPELLKYRFVPNGASNEDWGFAGFKDLGRGELYRVGPEVSVRSLIRPGGLGAPESRFAPSEQIAVREADHALNGLGGRFSSDSPLKTNIIKSAVIGLDTLYTRPAGGDPGAVFDHRSNAGLYQRVSSQLQTDDERPKSKQSNQNLKNGQTYHSAGSIGRGPLRFKIERIVIWFCAIICPIWTGYWGYALFFYGRRPIDRLAGGIVICFGPVVSFYTLCVALFP